jgi:GNAT superfamily N-acetyltransferase
MRTKLYKFFPQSSARYLSVSLLFLLQIYIIPRCRINQQSDSQQRRVSISTPQLHSAFPCPIYDQQPSLTQPTDVPLILQFIRELADYEKALHEVEATESSLLATLSFPGDTLKRGSVYTALITPPATPENPSPKPVGMALFFYNYSTWRAAPGIYLEDLYVQPAARGKGYGFKLLKWLAAKVLEIRGRRLEWSVLTWNEPSIKFYKQVGAKAMDEWLKMMVEGEALERLAEGSL